MAIIHQLVPFLILGFRAIHSFTYNVDELVRMSTRVLLMNGWEHWLYLRTGPGRAYSHIILSL
jgi:hypothetical protein